MASSHTTRTISCLRIFALGIFASAPALASAQTAPAPAPAPATTAVVPAPSPLAQIPGVTVRYYDVTGVTIEAMRASIESQRPRDEATGIAIPTSSSWEIRTGVRRETTGTQCRIVGATATFVAEVIMPRLVNVEAVPAPVLTHWQTWVASLEQQQAERLLRPYQRLSEVERAVMAATCEGAAAASNRAIAEITAAPPPPPPPAVPAAPAQ